MNAKSIKPITFHFLRKCGGRGETGNNKAEEGGRGLIPYTILGRTRRCLHQNGLDTHTHTRANRLFRAHICLPACVVRPFSLAGLLFSGPHSGPCKSAQVGRGRRSRPRRNLATRQLARIRKQNTAADKHNALFSVFCPNLAKSRFIGLTEMDGFVRVTGLDSLCDAFRADAPRSEQGKTKDMLL